MQDLGKSLGRKITGIVHGAGLEDSKLSRIKLMKFLIVSLE